MRILPGIPLLPVLAAFVAGELAACVFENDLIYGAAIMVALCVVAWWKRRFVASFAMAFALLGGLAMSLVLPRQMPVGWEGRMECYEGRVEEVVASPYNQRAIVDVCAQGERCRALVYFHSTVPPLEPGDLIVFRGAMASVHDGSAVPEEFSIGDYAFRRGLSACCDVAEGDLSVGGFRDSPSAFFARMRERLSEWIYLRLGLDGDAAAMLEAVLTGNGADLAPELRSEFATAGVAHVLALSGTHVAVLSFLLVVLLIPLRMAGHRKIELVGVIALLWGYVLLTGCSPSVVRTVIMASAVLLGRMLRRGVNPLNNLCLAALLILIFDPMALFYPGFQLSFAAVAGILMFAFGMMPGRRLPSGLRPVVQCVVVCIAATVATAPLAAWHFHTLPMYFLLANLPVGLLLPVFMSAGVLLLALQWAGLDVGWLVMDVDWIYDAMTWVTANVVALPGAAVGRLYFPAWLLVPYYMAVGAAWYAMQQRRLSYGIACAMLLGFTVMAGWVTCGRPSGTEAYGVRDYYASTVLLREEGQAWLLTDAPPKFHGELRGRMERRLADFMGRRGVDSLEVVTGLSCSRAFYADSLRWVIGDRLIALVGAAGVPDLSVVGRNPDYALVTRGFKGDAVDVWDSLHPDTIVLSRALYPTRLEALRLRLDTLGIPFRIGLEGVVMPN